MTSDAAHIIISFDIFAILRCVANYTISKAKLAMRLSIIFHSGVSNLLKIEARWGYEPSISSASRATKRNLSLK